MKRKLNRMVSILLALAALLSLMAVGVSAANPEHLDQRRKCNLNMRMRYPDENGKMQPVKGQVGLYRVALSRYSDPDELFIPTATFVGAGIDLHGIHTEEDLLKQVPVSALQKHINEFKLKPKYIEDIDDGGFARFNNISAGLYLVCPVRPEEGPLLYSMNPFLITLPRKEADGTYDYKCRKPVDTKVEITPAVVDIQVVKQWKKDQPKDRPKSITVNLMNGSQVADTAVLTASNGWKWTFADKPADIVWTVQEKPVKGYDGKVGELVRTDNTYEVIITNTWDPDGKLEQTGQLNWPVPVLIVGGLTLILGGYALCHEKKKF